MGSGLSRTRADATSDAGLSRTRARLCAVATDRGQDDAVETERGYRTVETTADQSRGAVAAHLGRMHAQREALFDALAGVSEERLWARPVLKKWSPGEPLDHTRVLTRSFRRLLTVAWPVVSPWPALLPGARRRLERPYPTDIDDVYQRPSMPSWVGFLWPPKRTPSRPASVVELERALATEHEAIERFYVGKPEPLLGHVSVWDPAIGRLSVVQVLRVGVHHDQHHYTAVRRLLGR